MTLGKVYSGYEEKPLRKKYIPHKNPDGFPRSKIRHNYYVKFTDGSSGFYQLVTGDELRQLANGKICLEYKLIAQA